jgi:hypothetical protein
MKLKNKSMEILKEMVNDEVAFLLLEMILDKCVLSKKNDNYSSKIQLVSFMEKAKFDKSIKAQKAVLKALEVIKNIHYTISETINGKQEYCGHTYFYGGTALFYENTLIININKDFIQTLEAEQ